MPCGFHEVQESWLVTHGDSSSSITKLTQGPRSKCKTGLLTSLRMLFLGDTINQHYSTFKARMQRHNSFQIWGWFSVCLFPFLPCLPIIPVKKWFLCRLFICALNEFGLHGVWSNQAESIACFSVSLWGWELLKLSSTVHLADHTVHCFKDGILVQRLHTEGAILQILNVSPLIWQPANKWTPMHLP